MLFKETVMPELEIIGRDGRRRRARKGETLADSQRFTMPMALMDAAAREVADRLADKYGGGSGIRVVDTAGYRLGFLLVADRALHDAGAAPARAHDPTWRKLRRSPEVRIGRLRKCAVRLRGHSRGTEELI